MINAIQDTITDIYASFIYQGR